MMQIFKDIKLVGFDLDNTLYENNSEIDYRIATEIAETILKHKPELENIDNARMLCDKLYEKTGSRTQSLKELGIKNAGQIAYECMERADFLDLIQYDEKLVQLMTEIHNKYSTFLITSSFSNLAAARLRKIGLDEKLFDYILFGESAMPNKKIDGSIFSYFLKKSNYLPQEHVYIGDNLKGDILPAKSVGIRTIAIGNIPEADYSVRKIYDIRNLLL